MAQNRKGESPPQERQQQQGNKGGGTEVATQQGGAVAALDYGKDAGLGMENTTADSFAIPFLAVIQSNSPQCVQGDAKFMPEARPGMFLNTVTNKLYAGDRGVLIVPVAYRRAFLQWGPRQGEGGGFKGEHTAEAVAKLRAERKVVEFEGRLYEPMADGSVNPKRCNRYADTRMHYCMLLDESTAEYTPVLVSLTSTQIKKSKQLMSALSSVRVTTPQGQKIQPPTFANTVRVTSVPESNDQGNWHGVKFALEGQVTDKSVYESAKGFHDNVIKGSVTANFAESEAPGADAAQPGAF